MSKLDKKGTFHQRWQISRREVQVATQACLEQEISLLHVLEKVGKEEVQGSGSAQACSQGMEEQVAVKHLNLIL